MHATNFKPEEGIYFFPRCRQRRGGCHRARRPDRRRRLTEVRSDGATHLSRPDGRFPHHPPVTRGVFRFRRCTRLPLQQTAARQPPRNLAPRNPAIDTLYDQSVVIDSLAVGYEWDDVEYDAVKRSGYTGIQTTLPSPNFQVAARALAEWRRRIRENPDKLVHATTAADIERAKAEGKMAVLFGFQNATMLEGVLENLDPLYELGTRLHPAHLQLAKSPRQRLYRAGGRRPLRLRGRGRGAHERTGHHRGPLPLRPEDLHGRNRGLGEARRVHPHLLRGDLQRTIPAPRPTNRSAPCRTRAGSPASRASATSSGPTRTPRSRTT